AECVTRSEDRDSDELAAAQCFAHADMTCRDQVESVGRVAFMEDHLIAPVDLAPQPRDELESLVLRQRRQNRPVHDFTMARPACPCFHDARPGLPGTPPEARIAPDPGLNPGPSPLLRRCQATDACDVSSPAPAEWS